MYVLLCAMFVSLLCIGVRSVHASGGLEISEIMYDPSGTDTNREWIEIHNTSTKSIDLSGDSLVTDGVSSSHHALAPTGASALPSGAYALIVQDVNAFKTDYPTYSGLLFDSSWSGLTASAGKTIAVLDSGSVVLDQVNYDPSIGATNDGNSLQKNTAGTWVSALPTPGSETLATSAQSTTSNATTTDTSNTSSGGGAQSSDSGSASVVTVDAPQKVPAKVRAPHVDWTINKTATAGIPVDIAYTVYGANDEVRFYGSTHIAFGDGTEYGGSASEETTHVYEHAGTYIVKLDYRANPYMPKPDMTMRATVVVSNPSVVISRADDSHDIVLTNTSSTDADISGWILTSLADAKKTEFKIPDGTMLAPKAVVEFPRSVLGVLAGVSTISLLLPRHVEVSQFQAQSEVAPAQPVVASASKQKLQTPSLSSKSKSIKIVQNETLSAPLQKSLAEIPSVQPMQSNAHASIFWYAVFLMGVIACAVYAILKFYGIKKSDEPIPAFASATPDETSIVSEPISDTVRIIEE